MTRAQPPSFRRKPESRGAVQRGGARNSTQRLQTPFNSPLHIKGEGQNLPFAPRRGRVVGAGFKPAPTQGMHENQRNVSKPPLIPPCTSRGRENPRGGKILGEGQNLPFAPRRGRVVGAGFKPAPTQGMHEIQRNTQTTQHPILLEREPVALPRCPSPLDSGFRRNDGGCADILIRGLGASGRDTTRWMVIDSVTEARCTGCLAGEGSVA